MGYNKREIRVDNAKGLKKPKDIIVDPKGQWNHPGQITKIPSGDITMAGVPYPVLGVDNLGNKMMMMPGGNYTFPGDMVTEYPQMQMGGLTPEKAKRMLQDGTAHGHPLTNAQRQRFAEIAGTDEEGNELEGEMEEYKKGGRLKRGPKGRTSKNIQSSINEIIGKRNEMIYGPYGLKYFKPYADGGSISIDMLNPTEDLSDKDPKVISSIMHSISKNEHIAPLEVSLKNGQYNIEDGHHRYLAYKQMGVHDIPVTITTNSKNMAKKKTGGDIAFPQQPTAQQFYEKGFIPNSPVGFYMYGGMNTNEIAFPQQPTAKFFFSGYPWAPNYKLGGGMGKMKEMPCFECGGAHMQYGGIPEGYHFMPDGSIMPDDEMEKYKKGGWIQKANKNMERKGTKGAFTDYCGGKVTDECIKRGLNSPDPTTRKRAGFAKAMRGIHKQQGGETAAQGFDMDNVLNNNKNVFQNFLTNNTMSVLGDELEQDLFQYGGNNRNMNNEYMMNMYEDQLANEKAKVFGQGVDFLQQTGNMLGAYMQDGGDTPQYLTKADFENYMADYMKRQQPAYGYGYNQPVYQQRNYGAGALFPMNPWGPYYKTKFKGWSNMPMQGPGAMPAGAPQIGGKMSQEEMDNYIKYWADKGINAEVSQDVKSGLLGKWLGPRRVKTTAKFSYMPGQGQNQQNNQTGNMSSADNTGLPSVQNSGAPMDYSQFTVDPNQMKGKPILDWDMGQGVPVDVQGQGADLTYRQGGLYKFFQSGGDATGLNTSGPGWGFESTQKRKMGFAPGTADWMLAGEEVLANVFNRDERKAFEDKMFHMQGADANYYAQGMDKGDYLKDNYAGQSFRPDEVGAKVEPWARGYIPGNRGDFYTGAKYGGMPQLGGEVMMDDDQIAQFLAMGGQLEILD